MIPIQSGLVTRNITYKDVAKVAKGAQEGSKRKLVE